MNASDGKKGDLERGTVVGARQAGLNISETADLLRSRTRIARVYTWRQKYHSHQISIQ